MKSMTGYAACQMRMGSQRLAIEIKTLNHRYLEFKYKSSQEFSLWEPKILELVKNELSRGYVELSLYPEKSESGSSQHCPKLNETLLKHYLQSIDCAKKKLKIKEETKFFDLLSLPDVWVRKKSFSLENGNWNGAAKLIQEGLRRVNDVRLREGAILKKDILRNVADLREQVLILIRQKDYFINNTQEKLREKVTALLSDKALDEARLHQEVAYLLERSDVSEELVRLQSHMDHMKKMVNLKGPVGKNLDFLIQEMLREVNTIGSKVHDVEITSGVIKCKSILEKVREQIQNVE